MSSSRSELASIAAVAAVVACAAIIASSLGACSFRDLSDLTGGDAAAPPDASTQCTSDCLGGACVAGRCQPITLIAGRSQPWGIAIADDGAIYWSELGSATHPGSAYKLVVGVPPTASTYIVADVNPTWLFALGNKLYWASYYQPFAIGRCPIPGAGCTFHPKSTTPPGSIVASGSANGTIYVNNPDRVVADASGVYWTNAGSTISSRDGAILVCRASGCGNPPPQSLALFQSHPRGIALDEKYVYWANQGLGLDQTDGAVLRILKNSGGTAVAEKLAQNQASPAYVALDADNVYWTNGGDGTVMTVPKTGGTPSIFADGQGGALDIAVDATGVYWTTYGPSGTVAMCPLSGCGDGVRVLAALSSPYGIALDDEAVYFTVNDPTDGAVMKIAKP